MKLATELRLILIASKPIKVLVAKKLIIKILLENNFGSKKFFAINKFGPQNNLSTKVKAPKKLDPVSLVKKKDPEKLSLQKNWVPKVQSKSGH